MVQNLRAMLFLLNRKVDFPILPPCSGREYLTPQIHFSRIRIPFTPRVAQKLDAKSLKNCSSEFQQQMRGLLKITFSIFIVGSGFYPRPLFEQTWLLTRLPPIWNYSEIIMPRSPNRVFKASRDLQGIPRGLTENTEGSTNDSPRIGMASRGLPKDSQRIYKGRTKDAQDREGHTRLIRDSWSHQGPTRTHKEIHEKAQRTHKDPQGLTQALAKEQQGLTQDSQRSRQAFIKTCAGHAWDS